MALYNRAEKFFKTMGSPSDALDATPRQKFKFFVKFIANSSGSGSELSMASFPLAVSVDLPRIDFETQIVNRKANFKKQQFLVQLQQAKRNYESWKDNWQYYQKAALKVAKEQRKGALLAYKEGALDYVAFIQNLEEALRTELDAIEAAKSYLLAYADMKFYLGNDI